MKRHLLLFAAMLAMIGLAMLHDAMAGETVTMYVHTQQDMLNVRRDLTLDSPVEMRLERGAAVEVIRVQDGWAEIVGGEAGTAWCWAGYLADYPPGNDAQDYTVVSNGRVRVREAVSADFFGIAGDDGDMVLRWLHNGDTVSVQFMIGGWAYIGDGYVAAEYLEVAK